MESSFDLIVAGVSLVTVLIYLVQALREGARLPGRILPLLTLPLGLALVALTLLPHGDVVIKGLGLAAQAGMAVGYVRRPGATPEPGA